MSGSRAPHLQRRNGVYYLRVRVPDHVRPRLGQQEVHRSLGTYASSRARILAATYAARVMGAFEMIAKNDLSSEQARQLIAGCFADLVKDAERHGGFVPTTADPYFEREEQRHYTMERIASLRQQRSDLTFGNDVRAITEQLLTPTVASLDLIPAPRQVDLLDGIARALIEEQRLFLLRLDDRLAPFQPADPLFVMPAMAAPNIVSGSVGQGEAIKGICVGEAIDRYLAFGTKNWVRKTFAARTWQLRYLREHLGEQTPLAAVTAHDIRSFRDSVQSLRKNHGRSLSQTFLQKQMNSAEFRIADKTAILIFEPCKAFFRWSKSVEGLIDKNPAEDVRLVAGKQGKNDKPRRPFREPELRQLFCSPLWKGCKSRSRRYVSGDKIIRDAKFWIPILGYYTGARLGELVQLHFGDIVLDGDIPYLSINEENAAAAAGTKKHVKSAAGIRLVPLHPDAMDLGFLDFVSGRRKGKKSAERLFPEFPYGSDGQASTVFSKFFARLLDAVGLIAPSLVFHSFRHGAEDAFRDGLFPQYVIDRVIGHSDSSTSAGYGEGVALDVMYEAVCKMKLKATLMEFIDHP